MSIPKFIEVAVNNGGVLINTDQILYITDDCPRTLITMTNGKIIVTDTDYITIFEELQ